MSRLYTKGEKLRAKRLAQAMPKLAETPKREKNGQYKHTETRGTTRASRNADRPAMEARARHMGLTKDKAGEMKRERLSEGAGMAIDILCDPDAAQRLWSHYIAITASEARYHRSLGKSIHAKTAKIEMMQERFETRADDVVDLRTEEERDTDAVKSWMGWQGLIDRLPAHNRKAIYDAYRYHVELVDCGQVLPAGRRFVTAMERLDAVMP